MNFNDVRAHESLDIEERRLRIQSRELDVRERRLGMELREQQRHYDAAMQKAEVALAENIAERDKLLNVVRAETIREISTPIDKGLGTLFDLYNFSTADAITESQWLIMARNAYQLWSTDALARGWIETFVKFISAGFQLKSRDEDPETQKALDEFSQGYELPNGRKDKPLEMRFREFVRRTLRGGDSFMQVMVNEQNGDLFPRFLVEMWIQDCGKYGTRGSFGIVTSPKDIEQIEFVTYFPYINGRGSYYNRGEHVTIPAEELVYCKLGDSDAKRGRPLLLPITKNIAEINKLLAAVRKQYWVRSLYVMEKKIKGSWLELLRAKREREKATTANTTYDAPAKAPAPGSVLEHGDNVEVEFKTPDMQAADGDHAIRRQLLICTAMLGLTETVGLGDASNANKGSSEVAESPMLVTFKDFRRIFGCEFERLGQKALEAKMDAGELSRQSFKTERKASTSKTQFMIVSYKKTKTERDTRCMAKFDNLVVRDILAVTQALAIQKTQRWVDDPNAISELGRDPLEVSSNIELQEYEQQQRMEPVRAELQMFNDENGGNGVNGSGKNGNGVRPYGNTRLPDLNANPMPRVKV